MVEKTILYSEEEVFNAILHLLRVSDPEIFDNGIPLISAIIGQSQRPTVFGVPEYKYAFKGIKVTYDGTNR